MAAAGGCRCVAWADCRHTSEVTFGQCPFAALGATVVQQSPEPAGILVVLLAQRGLLAFHVAQTPHFNAAWYAGRQLFLAGNLQICGCGA
jgi:hypothetical protein